MATQWYCKLMGETMGPMKSSDLLVYARAGRIAPDTPIRKNDSKWFPANQVGGLFEAAGVTGGNNRCPYCSVDVPESHETCPRCHRAVDSEAPKPSESRVSPDRKPGRKQRLLKWTGSLLRAAG